MSKKAISKQKAKKRKLTYFFDIFDIYLPRSCPRQAITFSFGKFDGPQLFLIVLACLFGTACLLLSRAIQYLQTMFTKTLAVIGRGLWVLDAFYCN